MFQFHQSPPSMGKECGSDEEEQEYLPPESAEEAMWESEGGAPALKKRKPGEQPGDRKPVRKG